MSAAPACDQLRQDHREMEAHLDGLLAALLDLTPEHLPEVHATVRAMQQLAATHFEKEEGVFYPSLRPASPDFLAQMDRQHEEVREVNRQRQTPAG